jgi:UDP-N-acetylglucosamine acyltransferase
VVQFSRVGDYSFLGAHSLINKDVVPFSLVAPAPVRIVGINKVGLERAGFDEKRRREIRRAYTVLFRSGLSSERAVLALQEKFPRNSDVAQIISFATQSKRSLLRMSRTAAGSDEE